MSLQSSFALGRRHVGANEPTYFIADIAANHDGSLDRAVELIGRCAEAGADAAKFQNFAAATIVSDYGFRSLGGQQSHQATWDKSVFEVYDDASISLDWTETLRDACRDAGIDYLTAPYDLDMIPALSPHVCAWKVGSGDITWPESLVAMAADGKPFLLATGASDLDDVDAALRLVMQHTDRIVLMQCNTNYTASLENFHYVNLRVLQTYAQRWPDVVLGLSDHTPGHATVLGAVAFGARVIEKHFTDDTDRVGPDHRFSMDPTTWHDMVARTRELEAAFGDGIKRVEANEAETVVLQRRAVRAARDLAAGEVLSDADLVVLRPCPTDALSPWERAGLVGATLARAVPAGDCIRRSDLA